MRLRQLTDTLSSGPGNSLCDAFMVLLRLALFVEPAKNRLSEQNESNIRMITLRSLVMYFLESTALHPSFNHTKSLFADGASRLRRIQNDIGFRTH